MVNGLDSASRINAKAAKAAGYAAWGRYLTGSYAMTASEVQEATAAGIGLWSIFEENAQSALGGANQGLTDAKTAVAAAVKLGQPASSAIYCTVDFDPTPEQLPTVVSYCKAFVVEVRAHNFRGGVYGGTSVMNAVTFADCRWQAGGWSNGVVVAGCQIQQHVQTVAVGGVTCDLNTINVSDYGAWNANGVFPKKPKPKPKPKPQPKGQDVKLAQTLTGKTTITGKCVIDSTVPWANRGPVELNATNGLNASGSAYPVNAAGRVRVVVTGAPRRAVVTVDIYTTEA